MLYTRVSLAEASQPLDGTSSIFARGLVKRFGSVRALDGMDLEVGRGEIVALLGANGAGKSTLLRILGTTVLPDDGTATVMGHDVASEEGAVQRSVGLMVGDERSWYWRLTGRHNLEFFAVLHGMRRRAAARRSAELLVDVGLEDAAGRRFDGYSSGMRARLSLARALIANPPVLLLDEPTQSLDALAAVNFRETVMRLALERQAGILFATHDLHEAAAIANRIVGISRGRVAFLRGGDADPRELEAAIVASA